MVLRRSTTRCTWPKDFSNSERSTVTFIVAAHAIGQPSQGALHQTSKHAGGGERKLARRASEGKGGQPKALSYPGLFVNFGMCAAETRGARHPRGPLAPSELAREAREHRDRPQRPGRAGPC